MKYVDWGLVLMVIEITKKHIITAVACLVVGAGSENTLHIKYLQSKKDQYQDIVQQLENGFNHGNLDAGH